MKKCLSLAAALCLFAALPAAAQEINPATANMTGHQCYTISSGLAGGWTLNVDLRFMKKTIAIAGRGLCTQATNPPGKIKTYLRGNYYPVNRTMTIMGNGTTAPGKNAPEVNAQFNIKVPYEGEGGTGFFSCTKADGSVASY